MNLLAVDVLVGCKSNFSFLEGASHPEELVETLRGAGNRSSLALTDRDGVYGIVEAYTSRHASWACS